MNQVDVIFNNGKIVTQGKVIEGFVAVDGEKIVAVGQGDHAPDARKVIDLKGRVLIPGVVDPECHFGSHRWVGDEFDSETRGRCCVRHHHLGFHAAEREHGTTVQS